MKIFLVLSNPPNPFGEAIEVVAHEVIEKASALGHHLGVQVILRDPRHGEAAGRAERSLAQLRIRNALAYPMLYVEDVIERGDSNTGTARLKRILMSLSLRRLFPASRLGPEIEQRVREFGAEAILSIWSWEALAATYRISGVPKFVYYGNPDHLPAQARHRHPDLFGIPRSSLRDRLVFLFRKIENRRRRTLNVKMMKACEVTANNSVLDVNYYAEQGHTRSIYLRNMWPAGQAPGGPAREAKLPVKIIGSVGNLGATGNTFALAYLGRELLPRLSAQMKNRPFEIHLLGKGTPSPGVAHYLTDPRIKVRGWVEDIEGEFRSAAAFLVLTNVSPDFLVGNTRILLAWALRTCVIMHENSRLAMPEIEHGVNALLGRTPDEICGWITAAVEDEALRTRIGQGGGATFDSYYRSDVVVPCMLGLVEDMVAQFKAGRQDRLPASQAPRNNGLRAAPVEQRQVH